MTSIYAKDQTLPQGVTAAFESVQADIDKRNSYAAALRAAGWTLSAIADSSGISRERVRQVVSTATPKADGLPVPTPPLRPQPAAPKEYAKPDPAKLARLQDLQPLARKVTGSSKNNRLAGEDYTKLIAEVHLKDGVPLYRLAKYLDVTAGALRSRLVRYEYIEPKGGKSKSYNRINPENRMKPTH